MIESVAEWLVIYGAASVPEFLAAVCVGPVNFPSADLMTWCQSRAPRGNQGIAGGKVMD